MQSFRNISSSVLFLTAALALPACNRGQSTEATDGTSGSENDSDANAQRDVSLTPANANPSGAACTLSRVYFGFDAAELDNASRAEIQRAVECFRANGTPARLHLTGATDPRGTEEYNIALGDRRAQAVRQYLVSLGVDAGRISVTSVGEEMAEGTDEEGWARDRAVGAE